MLHRNFETDAHDAELFDITVSEEKQNFVVELAYKPIVACKAMAGKIGGLCRIYEMDNPLKQHFEISYNSDRNLVILRGNINNALLLLQKEEFISESLYQEINKDKTTQLLLEKSKEFKIKEVELSAEEEKKLYDEIAKREAQREKITIELETIKEEIKNFASQRLESLTQKYNLSPEGQRNCREEVADALKETIRSANNKSPQIN